MQLVIPSPAKLNLFLHITGRLANGYHQLQTVFQLLEYGDTITLSSRDDDAIRLTTPLTGVTEQQHLAVRAAEALRRYVDSHAFGDDTHRHGVDIAVEKVLPMGGGLGGGSSNAASTLLGLNQLWQLDLSIDELAIIGLELGADVPVFVRGQNSAAEGVGEVLQPIKLPNRWFVVIKPPVEVATATIFGHPQLTRDSLPIRIAAFFETTSTAQMLRNDCQAVVLQSYPEVADAFHWLSQFGDPKLTGTGSCIFLACDDQPTAHAIIEQLPQPLTGFIAQSSDYSTAYKALGIAVSN